MKLGRILGLSFLGVGAASSLIAAAVYLPRVATNANFFGTELVDNQAVYKKIKEGANEVKVFDTNHDGNVAKLVSGTPNVSLDVLLDGTNDYTNGNYVVLFASDGDLNSNLFLYNSAYRFNANNDSTVNFNKFGFTIDQKNKEITFNPKNVDANFANGNIQKAFQFLTNAKNKALDIMAELPSIVLIHDKISYAAMESLIDYVSYVDSCFHDVVINMDGTYTFEPDTPNYNQFIKNNPNVGEQDKKTKKWNFKMATSLELFQKLVGFDKSKNESDWTDEDKKLSKQASDYETEYKWASNLRYQYNSYYGFQFNPVDAEFNVNTYTDPFGKTKPYRTDIGAQKYVQSFQLFKEKLSPSSSSYVNAAFANQGNAGHFIGFAHTSISDKCVLLSNDYANIPNNSNNLDWFAGSSSNSRFTANIISLYNAVTNKEFKGETLNRFNGKKALPTNFSEQWLPTINQDTKKLKSWYTAK